MDNNFYPGQNGNGQPCEQNQYGGQQYAPGYGGNRPCLCCRGRKKPKNRIKAPLRELFSSSRKADNCLYFSLSLWYY